MKGASVLVLILKWILIPVALLWVGYQFVGPRIGSTAIGSKITGIANHQPDANNPEDTPKVKRKAGAEPKVEVSVQRGTTFRSRSYRDYGSSQNGYGISSRPRRRRHSRRHSSTDNGGAAPQGATDAGGSTGGGDMTSGGDGGDGG